MGWRAPGLKGTVAVAHCQVGDIDQSSAAAGPWQTKFISDLATTSRQSPKAERNVHLELSCLWVYYIIPQLMLRL